MTPLWFVHANEVVVGPFNTEQIRQQMTSGGIPPDSYVWWKGQREWMPLSVWQARLPEILNAAQSRAQKPIWYIDLGNSPLGPLTQNELIDNLKGVATLNRVKLWAIGMQKWTSLFELHDIMEVLGISRRENERAPLLGTAAISRSNDDPKGFVLKTSSISIAGMGVTGHHDLRRGDRVSVLVKSNELGGSIHLKGEVAYVTRRQDTGQNVDQNMDPDVGQSYAGIRFQQVHPEIQDLIRSYVKRFNARVEKASSGAAA